jgi:hypothetical protein
VTGAQQPGRLSHGYRRDNIALIVIASPMPPRRVRKSFAPFLVVISKECSLAMATSQPIANPQRSYEGFENKHDMACTTQ